MMFRRHIMMLILQSFKHWTGQIFTQEDHLSFTTMKVRLNLNKISLTAAWLVWCYTCTNVYINSEQSLAFRPYHHDYRAMTSLIRSGIPSGFHRFYHETRMRHTTRTRSNMTHVIFTMSNYRPQTKLREDNVFTGVCLWPRGKVNPEGMYPLDAAPVPSLEVFPHTKYAPLSQVYTPCRKYTSPPEVWNSHGSTGGWYAPYWNVSLLHQSLTTDS